MKKTAALVLLFSLLISACACTGKNKDGTDKTDAAGVNSTEPAAYDFTFSAKDAEYGYGEGATRISLSDEGITVEGGGAFAEGSVLTVKNAGTYILSGTLSDGMIKVNGSENDKIELVFDGVNVKSSSAAVLIESGNKVFINLNEGSENYLSDGESYALTVGDSNVDAAIFSKSDLCIKGKGSLTVTGNYKHAVVSKDDLVVHGAAVNAESKNVGLNGKDCVKISGASIRITAGSDGIRSDNAEDSDRGFVYIQSGSIDINSTEDAIQAETSVKIDGGTIGISSGDDAIHAEKELWITGGDITVDKCVEGFEGERVYISGGTSYINASDDGLNAAAPESTAQDNAEGFGGFGGKGGFGGGKGGFGAMGASESCEIVISGGNTYINAGGDGVDSNGSLTVTGGVLCISGSENGGNGNRGGGEGKRKREFRRSFFC